MTAVNVKQELDAAVEQSADVAKDLLRQDGWAILRQLYMLSAAAINSTSVVILPVLANLDEIKAKLTDPDAFHQMLRSTQEDLGKMIQALQHLSTQHIERSGVPADEDVGLISTLSLGYSEIQGHMDRAVQPLLLAMIETMQEAGVDTVALTDKKGV